MCNNQVKVWSRFTNSFYYVQCGDIGGTPADIQYCDKCRGDRIPLHKDNTCTRTHRKCVGGAWDGEDGWGIDCPAGDHTRCAYKV